MTCCDQRWVERKAKEANEAEEIDEVKDVGEAKEEPPCRRVRGPNSEIRKAILEVTSFDAIHSTAQNCVLAVCYDD